jgi:hypothetical protein
VDVWSANKNPFPTNAGHDGRGGHGWAACKLYAAQTQARSFSAAGLNRNAAGFGRHAAPRQPAAPGAGCPLAAWIWRLDGVLSARQGECAWLCCVVPAWLCALRVRVCVGLGLFSARSPAAACKTIVVVQTRSTEYDSIKKEFERTALDRATMIETRVDGYALCRSLSMRWQCFDIAIHRGVCVACMRCSAGANDGVIG